MKQEIKKIHKEVAARFSNLKGEEKSIAINNAIKEEIQKNPQWMNQNIKNKIKRGEIPRHTFARSQPYKVLKAQTIPSEQWGGVRPKYKASTYMRDLETNKLGRPTFRLESTLWLARLAQE